jgi:hypothetical protein
MLIIKNTVVNNFIDRPPFVGFLINADYYSDLKTGQAKFLDIPIIEE